MSNISSEQENQTNGKIYYSFEEWKRKTFPNLIKRNQRKAMEKRTDRLGKAIAKEIAQEIFLELSKKS